MGGAPYTVFISHAHANRDVAKLIARVVDQAGARHVLDIEHITAGDDFCEWIDRTISRCQELLILVSPEFLGSQFLTYELGVARACGLWVAPILYRIDMQALTSTPIGQGVLARRSVLSLDQFDTAYESQLKDRIARANGAGIGALLGSRDRRVL